MTIDEFKAVMAVAGIEVKCYRMDKRYPRSTTYKKNTYYAWLAPYKHTPVFANCTGRTEKAALKKLKDWYMYGGRKNGNC
jgi:hypothetical protein